MFDTTFSHASATALPPNLNIDQALKTLHDFETVIRLSPDCRGCRPVPPPQTKNGKINGAGNGAAAQGQLQYYEVEDDLPFIPKKLWSGGVKYTADFLPTEDGCDITIHAPGGFTSTNHWRILREHIPEDGAPTLKRLKSKDLAHADMTGDGWYVEIVSDAKCSKTFAGFVKGFLKNSHAQLQRAFIERLKARPVMGSKRPTLGRRRSSEL
ncbi:hypothetical protein LTR36_003419 [Oleoguttula mirabilis]|uniref:DUF7053 domain-containing protein n=1 Tax=Oleoguttula mirabilis TaxID=1507867 RepID=A0AAV9JJR3_9PEZI|nr:hypothetical protein LTR36_003419 [Oleoguttula mirabilis]